jgi:cytochrome oxidase Cu insertion factor (SCO1/SenC/PrrC family)
MRELLLIAALLTGPAVSFADEAKPAPPPPPKFKVGNVAPDFTLKDQAGKEVTLSSFRGKKNVVLAFYVFAFTGG